MKYINHPEVGMVLFEDHLAHSQVAAKLGIEPVSAGFVHQSNAGVKCHGESVSLHLKARDKDTVRLNAFLREM